jgi:putative membrane protein
MNLSYHITRGPLKPVLLYFIILAGGLWHRLQWFQTCMRLSAGPFIILITLWLVFEWWVSSDRSKPVVLWCVSIIIVGFFIEWLGITTSLIFGTYQYSRILQPQLFRVPVAIGFAWLSTLLGCLAFLFTLKIKKTGWLIFLGSVMMTGFDRLMEPAARQLNYWTWPSGQIPARNFIAWLIISTVLMSSGISIWKHHRPPRLAMHALLAQSIYFLMVIF